MKTKFITLAVAIMMIVMATTVTAFAATGTWKHDEATNTWTCTDKNGDAITEQWVKSGDQWFWLNSDGIMATAQLVDDGTNLFCVDENGQMVHNNWVKVTDDTFDNQWLYFGANGKAYQNGWRTIKNESYHFTQYAMDEGFLDASGNMIDKDSEEVWKDAVYYVGSNGNMRKNYWLEVDAFDAENGKAWIFFGPNGKKVTSCKKVINGKTYVFDAEGKMLTSFVDATVATASAAVVTAYMDENGAMLKKGWVYAFANEDADEKNWFYAANNGELVKGVVKTINNKKYAFDADGKMLTGFVQVNADSMTVESVGYSAENVTFEKATSDLGTRTFMYFTENADPMKQGAAVTGNQTIAIEEGNLTIKFSSRGMAAGTDGKFVIKNNCAYINSVLYARSDMDHKYEVIMDENGEFYILIVKTGRVSKKGTFTDADNDIKYIIKDGVVTIQHKNSAGKWE